MSARLAMFNGRLEEAGAAGVRQGTGVFTTVRVMEGRLAFLPEHHRRLVAHAAALGLTATPGLGDLRERARRLVEANGLAEAALRVALFDDGRGVGELLQMREVGYTDEDHLRGFALLRVTAPAGDPLAQLKTLANQRYVSARRAAREAGFDEALLVSPDGRVLEGAFCNVFCVAGGRLVTPPASEGLLPGIARAVIVEGRCGVAVEERPLGFDEIVRADEAFLSNSLMGVMPVAAVGGSRVGGAVPGPVTRAVSAAWRAAERASLA